MILADRWRDRLVAYRTPATGGTTALCLDPVDLVAAKLAAGREKDREFVTELRRTGLVALDAVVGRIGALPIPPEEVDRLRVTADRLAR